MPNRRFALLLSLFLGSIATVNCGIGAPTGVPLPATEAATIDLTTSELEAIEVTYFTPTQQEGPFYPIDKPADRDNDLVDFDGSGGVPAGES